MNDPHSKSSSTFTKMRQVYWEAKQSFNKSLGQRDDCCIVSSDSELDIRLELLQTADNYFNALMRVLLDYRDALEDLVNTQDNFGIALIKYGLMNSTAAGKIMCLSGQSISKAAQKQSQLKTTLMNLFYEVETFQFKATSDALQTVAKMEKTRRSYRSGLMWLKKESVDLDPDVTKKMRNFRRVQEHIKNLKVRFDGVKLECMQKIDLFLLSRSNLFSQTLVPYIKMFKKVSKRSVCLMEFSLKNIPLCLSYNFVALKELNEYSKVFQTTLQQQSEFNQVPKKQNKAKIIKKSSSLLAAGDNLCTTRSKHCENLKEASLKVSDPNNMLLIDLKAERINNKSLKGDTLGETSSQSPCRKYSDDLLAIDFENYKLSSSTRFSIDSIENCFEKPLSDFTYLNATSKGDDDLQFWSLMRNLEQSSKTPSINGTEKSKVTPTKQHSEIVSQTKWNEILIQFDPFLEEKSKGNNIGETLDLC